MPVRSRKTTKTAVRVAAENFPGKDNAGLRAHIRGSLKSWDEGMHSAATRGDAVRWVAHSISLTARGKASLEEVAKAADREASKSAKRTRKPRKGGSTAYGILYGGEGRSDFAIVGPFESQSEARKAYDPEQRIIYEDGLRSGAEIVELDENGAPSRTVKILARDDPNFGG